MKNELAKKLVAAADKYRAVERKYEGAEKVVQSDYEDLISIAGMIENNESKKSIARAMWNLDTAVRDVIPDKVYNTYN
jgi:hypothetical protein